jgi:hypothetical protein
MKDGESKVRGADRIDFPALWVLVRIVQILLLVIYAKFTYLSLGTDSFVSGLISSICFLLIIGAFVHGVATGTVDSSGIHYRRYFRMKTVEWSDVQGIEWVTFRLKILITSKGKRKRKLVFLLNPLKSIGAYWAHRLGAEVAPPEILERIHALPIETPPNMGSAPPYSRWILRVFVGFGVLFVLVFLWRILSATSPVSH